MTCGMLYSALLNLPTGQVVLALVWPLALLPASLPSTGVSSPLLSCCFELEMFAGLLKVYAKEPENSLVDLG